MNSNLNKLVQAVARNTQDAEKLAIPLLVSKLNKLAEQHPYDQTIVMSADILAKHADKRTFITRAELRGLYNKLYSRNTKFAEYFADELGEMPKMSAPKLYEKHEAPITNMYEGVNPVLSNAFDHAVDKTVPLKGYSKQDGDKAQNYVTAALDAWNVKPQAVEIVNGNEQVIVIQAKYETPKGVANILVPVEIKAGKMLQPAVFVREKSLVELNHNNVKDHIMAQVNKKVNQTSYGTDVEIPEAPETQSFAEKFNSALGVANFKFGMDKVNLGRDAVIRCLSNLNVHQVQAKVVDTQDNTVVYGVSIGGKVAFKVPVKFANNKVLSPEMLICNGAVMPLNKTTLHQLFVKNESDYGVAATTSALHGLKTPDLIQAVKDAAHEHNYAKAEDALNVLQQTRSEQEYKEGLAAYMNGLSLTKTAEIKSTCSKIIKSSASQHPVCGHTGLPVHKVYQDEHGNCQPLYRKNMPQQTETAYFNNYKILG